MSVARSAYGPEPPKPLAGVGKVLVGVLLAIVAAIWLTLITLVVRVAASALVSRKRQPAACERDIPAK